MRRGDDWRAEVKRDSPFLYHWDIEGASPMALEITGFERQDAYCPGKEKTGAKGSLWCIRFKGKTKMLGCNVTNGHLISHSLGSHKTDWIGKTIILRLAECDGERCIRVHAVGVRLPKQCRKFRYLDADPSGVPAATGAVTPETVRAILAECERTGADPGRVCAAYGAAGLVFLSATDAAAALALLRARPSKAGGAA